MGTPATGSRCFHSCGRWGLTGSGQDLLHCLPPAFPPDRIWSSRVVGIHTNALSTVLPLGILLRLKLPS